ncbi:MAG: SurA N-terminal domain-containing protein [Dehalococcoidia bacterium]
MSKKPPSTSSSLQPAKGRPGARPVTRQRRAISHASKDDRGTRLAWYVGGGIVVVVLVAIFAGYYNDNIKPARGAAITVGKHDISLGYYRDRLKAITITTGAGTQRDAFNKEATTTNLLESEQVYLQRAASLGVTVNDDEIAAAIAKDVHATIVGGKVSDPAQYEALLRTQLIRTGLSLDQERQLGRAAALKQKVQDTFKAGVPKQALSVKGIQLIFSSQDQATQAQQRIETGDTPSTIAGDMLANQSLGRSQTFDWTPVPFGLLPGDVDRFAAEHASGEISAILKIDPSTPTGSPQWIITQISDRDPNHDVTDAQSTQVATKKSADWFDSQKTALNVHSYVDGSTAGSKAVWAAQHTDLPVDVTATPTPPSFPSRPGAAPSAPAGAPVGPQPAGSAPAAPGAPGAAPAAPGAAPVAPPQPPAPVQPVPNASP